MIFLDTSAVYALADRRDPNHRIAVERFQAILDRGEELLLHNYVILESVALLQSRLGLDSALKFARESSAFAIEWIDKDLHDSGARELERSAQHRLSLVDHLSFLVMRRRKTSTAFAFDPDFKTAGFQLFE